MNLTKKWEKNSSFVLTSIFYRVDMLDKKVIKKYAVNPKDDENFFCQNAMIIKENLISIEKLIKIY